MHLARVEIKVTPPQAAQLPLVVTPRMHGIHHSVVRSEINSNWSSGLSLLDRLHGTLRLNVPPHDIVIRVPAYREPDKVTLGRIIALPFTA